MNTVAINIRDAPPGWQNMSKYVYIGEPRMEGEIEYDGAPLSTPFSVPKDGPDALAIWMKYMDQVLWECEEIFDKAQELLPGKVLVCDCDSGMRLCHGWILAAIADGKLWFAGAVLA